MPTVWPVSLPAIPLAEGYSERAPDLLLRSSMDQGPTKVRRRFTAGVRNYTVVFVLTATQLSTFNTFYTTTILSGALPFDWTDPGGASRSIRIVGPPQYEHAGFKNGARCWRVAMNWEALP